jgi:putative ABC transport system permease protein
MVKDLLTAAWRVFLRNKQFAAISILGLAVGLASCLVMAGYVLHEPGFENGHARKDRILRANGLSRAGGGPVDKAAVVAPLGPTAKETIPEVDHAVRFAGKYDVMVTVANATFTEKKMYFIEPEALDGSTLPLVRGNPRKALEAPFSLVIDEVLAHRYFGNDDPLGRTIRVEFDKPYEFRITGVMKALPANTGLFVRMLASFSTLGSLPGDELRLRLKSRQAFELYYTLLQLRAGVDPQAPEAKAAG